jgi:hypothetical protein
MLRPSTRPGRRHQLGNGGHFSVGVRGRISSEGEVPVGEVAVGGIGACVVTVQADSAMVAERKLMASQLSPTRSASKFMRACSSGITAHSQS